MSRCFPVLLFAVLLVVSVASPIRAQDAATPTVAQLMKLIEDQRALLSQQQKELERQGQLLVEQAAALEAQNASLIAVRSRVDQMSMASGPVEMSPEEIALRDRLAKVEEVLAAPPEAPEGLVKAGDFPGSISVPGTNMAVKAGGFVRLGVVDNFSDIGSDDRFIVGSIPPEGSGEAGESRRVTISAKRSRLNLDFRMDSSVGEFRAFLEGDFAGAGGSDNYRLRHAFGQYGSWVLGQTWSTFADLQAMPEELDFEGLNAQLITRQPLWRWSKGLGEKRSFNLGLEDPSPQITGGDGVSVVPDFTGNFKRTVKAGHIQTSILLRKIIGQRTDDEVGATDLSFPTGDAAQRDRQETYGWGLSTSGSFRIQGLDQRDNLKFQLNYGHGIGRYMNDLDSVGGQDAVFAPDGSLNALPAFGGWIAFQHFWRERSIGWLRNLRSTVVYGLVSVDNSEFQTDDSYRRTQRATANVIWSPISSIDIGLEFLWGERLNKGGSRGRAGQVQGVATFRF